jgi:two-component sensor histidine kinase
VRAEVGLGERDQRGGRFHEAGLGGHDHQLAEREVERVRDDGIGLPVDFDVNRSGTLGLQLVHALVQQIDGRMTIERGGVGAGFVVEFPLERAK